MLKFAAMKQPFTVITLMLLSATTVGVRSQDAASPQATPAILVAGAVEKPREWTQDQIKTSFAADIKSIAFTLKGIKGEAHCVALLALVQAAKPKVAQKPKNHQLSFVVIVTARDGYTASFSMGELMQDIGKRAVWVALDRDGKPLSEAAAPMELLAVDDEKPSRWVHAISKITILDGVQAAAVK